VLSVIASCGVAHRVHVVGEVDDVWPYIYACDAVAVPSVHPESFPTIALEALAAGRPVLASDIGGLAEIVSPGSGWLLPPGDTQAWSQRLSAIEPRHDLQQ
jgi:glycosyltransferase involved in cell wall biosynthesis